MNQSCAAVGPEVDEFELAGLTPAASRLIDVPRVAESPVSFECRKTQIIQLQSAAGDAVNTWLVLGEAIDWGTFLFAGFVVATVAIGKQMAIRRKPSGD